MSRALVRFAIFFLDPTRLLHADHPHFPLAGMGDMLTAEVADDVGLGGGIGAADSLRLESLEAKLDLILSALQDRPAAVPQIVVDDGSNLGPESPLGSHRVLIEEPAPFH